MRVFYLPLKLLAGFVTPDSTDTVQLNIII